MSDSKLTQNSSSDKDKVRFEWETPLKKERLDLEEESKLTQNSNSDKDKVKFEWEIPLKKEGLEVQK